MSPASEHAREALEARVKAYVWNEDLRRDILAALSGLREALADIAEWVRDGGHPDAPDDGERLAIAVYERAIAALAVPSFEPAECEHEWESADNEVVSNAAICVKCHQIERADVVLSSEPAPRRCGADHGDECDCLDSDPCNCGGNHTSVDGNGGHAPGCPQRGLPSPEPAEEQG